jgi:hypothetical protein
LQRTRSEQFPNFCLGSSKKEPPIVHTNLLLDKCS